jgi:large subunit ribosomal protein L23
MPLVSYPLTTERAVSAIERENKLTFIVALNATKTQLKKEVEGEFGEKISKITTMISSDGRKKAIVRFSRPGAAAEVGARLKIL